MSIYTTQVRFICEENIGLNSSADRPSVNDIVAQACSHIFDSDLQLFDPITGSVTADSEYKNILFPKILFHYYTREIGFETVGLWKLKLNVRLREILPYYNQLYESAAIKYKPLENVNVKDEHVEEKKDDALTHNDHADKTDNITDSVDKSVEPTTNVHGRQHRSTEYGAETDTTQFGETVTKLKENHSTLNAFSDTPQGSLAGVTDNNYLTSANKTTVEGIGEGDVTTVPTHTDTNTLGEHTVNSTSDSFTDTGTHNDNRHDVFDGKIEGNYETKYNNTTDTKFTHEKIGKEGTQSYSKMILEYRETFLNIDMMLIDELKDLFMTIWE